MNHSKTENESIQKGCWLSWKRKSRWGGRLDGSRRTNRRPEAANRLPRVVLKRNVYCFLKLHKEYWELNYSRCLDLVHFHMICSSEFLHKTELTTAEMTKQRVYSFFLWNFRSSDAYFHISMKLKTKIEKTKLSTTENAKECL